MRASSSSSSHKLALITVLRAQCGLRVDSHAWRLRLRCGRTWKDRRDRYARRPERLRELELLIVSD